MIRSSPAKVLWETAQALNRAAAAVSPAASHLPPLLFFTDPERTPRPWETAEQLPAGSGVVYRAFDAVDAGRVAERLRRVTADAGVMLSIGLDDVLAEAVGADGVHLPERAVDQATGLRCRHPDWLLTAAWHPEGELAPRSLPIAALSALIVSPVFTPGGASAVQQAIGLDRLKAAAGSAGRPVYALGGIGPSNVKALIGSGVCGIAGVAAIQAAFDPA